MVRIIETNLSWNGYDDILDYQSRVIEADDWESYVEEIKEGESVVRQSKYGALHGVTLPRHVRVENFNHDDFHLSCDVYYQDGFKTKKLAYLIDNNK